MFLQVSLITVLICLSKEAQTGNEILPLQANSTFNTAHTKLTYVNAQPSKKTTFKLQQKEPSSKSVSFKQIYKKKKYAGKLGNSTDSSGVKYENLPQFQKAKSSDGNHLNATSKSSPKLLVNGFNYLNKFPLSEQEKLKQLEDLYSLQNPLEEFKDAEKDAELFKAIYTSVLEYQKRWAKKFLHKFLRRSKRDEGFVCYSKELGCFREEGRFNYFDMLPSPPEEVNTQFILYTKKNPTKGQYISYENITSITSSNLKGSRKTKFIIHGFGSSCVRVWVKEMRDTLLKVEDVNVICVSWPDGAPAPNYLKAASNTRLVGRQVALLLEKMVKYANVNLKDVHLIGFSLGAHVSGFVGQRLDEMRLEEQRLKGQQRIDSQSLQGQRLGRITGLDPAGPFFESSPERMRLDKSDAEFVDVIHTNADSLLWGGLGAYEPLGHVDFYPNGGRVQKGCTNLFIGGVTDIIWPKEGDGRYLCNHRRGYKYFMESVVPVCKFPAFACRDYESFMQGECFPCSNCGNMGYYADKAPGRGKLYLITRDSEPFCANQYKVEIWHSGGPPMTEPVSTKGYFFVTFVDHEGKFETLEITRDKGKKIEAGTKTISIVVPHAALTNIVSLQVQYKTHRGWISSGYNRWAIDKISIMDSFGKIQSYCCPGFTMESGITVNFSLKPGDCNPRELTLCPRSITAPGIDFNNLNGYGHSPPISPQGGNLHVSTNTPVTPVQISTTNSSGTKSGVSTFSVIHSDSSPHTTTEQQEKDEMSTSHPHVVTNTTKDNNSDQSIGNMTKEEFVAWKNAPPPNRNPNPSSENKQAYGDSRVPLVINKMNPVIIIPAPQLGKENSNTNKDMSAQKHFLKTETVGVKNLTDILETTLATIVQTQPIPKLITVTVDSIKEPHILNQERQWAHEDLRIREDAQVSAVTEIDFPEGYEKFSLQDSQGAHVHDNLDESSIHLKQSMVPHKSLNNSFKYISKNYPEDSVILQDPTNSIIEGEVPFKERARAIKFDSTQNLNIDIPKAENNKETLNRQTDPTTTNTETSSIEFDRKKDPPSSPGNGFGNPSANHPHTSYAGFQEGGNRFRQGEKFPVKSLEPIRYTFPPTFLRPPKIVQVPFIPHSVQQPEKKEKSFISKIISRFTKSDQNPGKRQPSRPPNSYPNIRYENAFGGHEEALTNAAYLSKIAAHKSPNLQEDQPFFTPHRPIFREREQRVPITYTKPKRTFYNPFPFLPSFPPPPSHRPSVPPTSRLPKLFIRKERGPDSEKPPYYVQILPTEIGSFPQRRYARPIKQRIRPPEQENIPPQASNSRMDTGRSLNLEVFASPDTNPPSEKRYQEFSPFLLPFKNNAKDKYIPLRFTPKRPRSV